MLNEIEGIRDALAREQFGDRIADAVLMVTHREHPDEEGYLDYIRRSKEAAQKLAEIGYTNVYEFGGIIDWTGETVAES